MSDTKLDYQLQPRPDPFLTGQTGTLAIVISNFSNDKIRVKSIDISLAAGTDGTSLSGDLSKVKPAAIKGWSITGSDGSFTLTPDGGALDMGPSGFMVIIPGINVNDAPGATEVFILEQTEDAAKKPAHATKRLTLVKVSPNVKIDDFSIVPPTFKPGESVVLHWKATPGATYIITYPGHTIDHVKDQPNTPLPPEGSYTIENLAQDTPFTLTVTGGPKPLTEQKEAAIERAKVVNFVVDVPDPLYGQPVKLSWVAVAEHIEIEHGGKAIKSASGKSFGTLKGHAVVTPDSPDAQYTLTATAGKTTDQQTASVAVQVPEVSVDVDQPKVTYGKNPRITWGFKNRWDGTAELEVTGARTKRTYLKTTLKADQGKDASTTTTDVQPYDTFHGPNQKFDLGVGEGLVLSIKTPWFAREKPVEASKTLTFSGVQGLNPGVDYPSQNSYAGQISQDVYDYKHNATFIKQGMVDAMLTALAQSYGVAPDKILTAERWTVPFIVHGDGIKAVSLRINAWKGDSDWKKLWFDGMNPDPIGGNSVPVYAWYNSNGTKYRGQLSLFAPKSMLDKALMALHFTVAGEDMHVFWNATGDKALNVTMP